MIQIAGRKGVMTNNDYVFLIFILLTIILFICVKNYFARDRFDRSFDRLFTPRRHIFVEHCHICGKKIKRKSDYFSVIVGYDEGGKFTKYLCKECDTIWEKLNNFPNDIK